MINFDYVRPTTKKAAFDAASKNTAAKFIAGGTNLTDLMKRGVENTEKIIDINRLPLNKITVENSVVRIGALVLNSVLSEDPLITQKFPLLSQALKAGASPQLRNMATVGGNMMQRTRCSYFYDTTMPCNKRMPGTGCAAIGGHNRMHAIFGASSSCIAVHPSDMCIALAALDAEVILESNKGERRMAFLDFHRLPGNTPALDNNLQKAELITGITLANNGLFSKHSAYVKLRDRSSYAFALISVAAGLELDGNTIKQVRLAMGGVAHKPWRLTTAEKYLVGKPITVNHFEAAAALAMKEAKGYGENNFKLKLAPAAIVEALQKAVSKS